MRSQLETWRIQGTEQTYPGYGISDENAGDYPAFTRDIADRIARDAVGTEGETVEYDEEQDAYALWDRSVPGGDIIAAWFPFDLETVDGPHHLYAIGIGQFVWQCKGVDF